MVCEAGGGGYLAWRAHNYTSGDGPGLIHWAMHHNIGFPDVFSRTSEHENGEVPSAPENNFTTPNDRSPYVIWLDCIFCTCKSIHARATREEV
jgi:hypothetical protein